MAKGRSLPGWLLGLVVFLGAVACIVIAIKSPPKSRTVFIVQ